MNCKLSLIQWCNLPSISYSFFCGRGFNRRPCIYYAFFPINWVNLTRISISYFSISNKLSRIFIRIFIYFLLYNHDICSKLHSLTGLARCGKSCRLRWMNYLRPNLKRGNYTQKEEQMIMELHKKHGNKYDIITLVKNTSMIYYYFSLIFVKYCIYWV